MRILVIGGTGFVGRFLVPQLAERGHDVAVLHRQPNPSHPWPGVKSIVGDRNRLHGSRAEIRAFSPDVVIDLILSSGRQARDLIEICSGFAGRIVAISSIDVYRACGVFHGLEDGPLEPLPLREDSPLRTRLQTYPAEQIQTLKSIFGWLDDEYDKIPVEQAVMNDRRLPATILRLPMVYGPGDWLHRFYPMIKRMDDVRPVILMQRRVARWRSPRGYVENVAWAIALAAFSERAAGRIYNVAESASLTELEWARMIAHAVGWRGRFVELEDEEAPDHLRVSGNLDQHWVADSTRIREELGYTEPIDRVTAITRTVEWERMNPPPISAASFDYEAEDHAIRRARVASAAQTA